MKKKDNKMSTTTYKIFGINLITYDALDFY